MSGNVQVRGRDLDVQVRGRDLITYVGTESTSLVGRSFTWNTGMTGRLIGHAEDASLGGNRYERCMLVFQAPDGGFFCFPLRLFTLTPWNELVITGSGHGLTIYGPAPE